MGTLLGKPLGKLLPRAPLQSVAVRSVSTSDVVISERAADVLQV